MFQSSPPGVLAPEPSPREPMFDHNARFDRACAWLRNYTGDFPFYLSLREQLERKGSLSDRQIEAVERAIDRENARVEARSTPLEFSVKPGTIWIVGKHFARQIAFQAGLTRPHHALEVLECLRETPRAYQVRLRLTAQRTTHCAVCGAWLTDPVSVATGIGPVCAERIGADREAAPLEYLAKELETTSEVTTWFPKSAVKEEVKPSAKGPDPDVMAYVSEGLGEF